MTLETFAIIFCSVIGLFCYIGAKHLQKHTYIKYHDQKVGGGK